MDTMGAVTLLLGAGATWRLTRLIVHDDLTSRLRDRLQDASAEHTIGWAGRVVWWAAKVTSCPHCAAVYAAAMVYGGMLWLPDGVWLAGTHVGLWSAVTGRLSERTGG